MGDDTARGVAFPVVDGDRSSTAFGQQVFAAAASAVDERLAARIEAESDWYGTYVDHALALEQAQLDDPSAVPNVAAAGLAAVHAGLEFVRDDGSAVPLPQARTLGDDVPDTVEVVGRAEPDRTVRVPYRGQELTGDALHRQLDLWSERDLVEPGFAEAVRRVMANPEWLDLGDRTVVVLGGAAEMGPLPWLAAWGTTVAVVDLPRPSAWRAILDTVAGGAGRALVPVRAAASDRQDHDALAEVAGLDLVADLPAAWRWVESLDGPLVVGNYVYAHGATNVLVSGAVDAVTDALVDDRDDTAVAVLATPTDVYAVPSDAVAASQQRYRDRGRAHRVAASLSGHRLFAPNYPEGAGAGQRRLVDCQISQQGCNYALTKRIHRWRAQHARDAGHVSSINVAPATNTASVTDNRMLKAAYAAASTYDIEVFEPDTSQALMALLLVHDLHEPTAGARPGTPLEHPLDLLGKASCHGGLWRNPHAPRSVLPIAAARGLTRPSTWS